MFFYRAKPHIIVLVLFLLLGFSFSVNGQERADTATAAPQSFVHKDSSVSYLPVIRQSYSASFPFVANIGEVDTGLFGEQNRESLRASRNHYATFSVIGRAHQSLNYQEENRNGFVFKTLPYPCYLQSLDQWKLLRVEKVYTMLRYEWGNGQENSFDVEHAQTIGNFSYNLGLQTHLAEGIYVNEGVRDINVGFHGHHYSDTMRYGFDITFIYNLFHLNESGGIVRPEDYESDMEPRAIEINTPNAWNHMNDQHYGYRHWLRLGGHKDSSGHFSGLCAGYLIHQIDYKRNRSVYSDKTADTILHQKVQNQFLWSNAAPGEVQDSLFRIAAGLSHEYAQVKDSLSNFHSQIWSVKAFMGIPLKKAGNWENHFRYCLSGYNANDLDYRTLYTIPYFRETDDSTRKHKGFFQAGFHYNLFAPDYYISRQAPGKLKKQQGMTVHATLDFRNMEITGRYFLSARHTFLSENLQAVQLSGTAHILQGEVFLPLRWKGFGADLHLYAQHCDNDSLHLPVLSTRNAVYYGFPLFHDGMYLQLGAEMMYFSAFQADGYCASAQQFYTQFGTEIGNDFYINAFINVRIEHFHFYAAATNLMNALADTHPFQIPYYPAKGTGFRVGVSWRFYD